MKTELMGLYKVTWKHTAISYVVASPFRDIDTIKSMVRNNENRCDDIVGVERVVFPAFENDEVRKEEYVELFYDIRIG